MSTVVQVSSVAVSTVPGGGFLVVSGDGTVAVHTDRVEVSDEVFTHLEAVHPMTEAERDAALARLEQYTGRARSVPRPRDAGAQ